MATLRCGSSQASTLGRGDDDLHPVHHVDMSTPPDRLPLPPRPAMARSGGGVHGLPLVSVSGSLLAVSSTSSSLPLPSAPFGGDERTGAVGVTTVSTVETARDAARGELADWTAGGPLGRAWRALIYRRGRS